MMKKLVLNTVLIMTLFAAVYPVEAGISVSADIGEFTLGWWQNKFTMTISGEYTLTDLLTLSGSFGYEEMLYRKSDVQSGYNIWKFGAEGRMYWPFQAPSGFFAGLGAQYWLLTFYQGSLGSFTGGGFIFPFRAGYRWFIRNKPSGLYFEPYLGFQAQLSFKVEDFYLEDRYGGFFGGLNAGWLF